MSAAQHPFVVARDPVSPPAGLEGAVAALGNFDGLHRGHRGVVERARTLAQRTEKPCCVATFEPHPADFFARRPVIFRLTPPDAKAALLARLGLDGMVVFTFDSAFAALSARQFTEEALARRLGVSAIVAGYDFRFGAGRAGDAAFLQAEGARKEKLFTACTGTRRPARASASATCCARRRARLELPRQSPFASAKPTT